MQHESMNKLWTGDNGGILRCWDVHLAELKEVCERLGKVSKHIKTISKLHNPTCIITFIYIYNYIHNYLYVLDTLLIFTILLNLFTHIGGAQM